jgi:hypothetical protein
VNKLFLNKSPSTTSDKRTQVLPLSQVNTMMAVAVFDKDGKVTGAI